MSVFHLFKKDDEELPEKVKFLLNNLTVDRDNKKAREVLNEKGIPYIIEDRVDKALHAGKGALHFGDRKTIEGITTLILGHKDIEKALNGKGLRELMADSNKLKNLKEKLSIK